MRGAVVDDLLVVACLEAGYAILRLGGEGAELLYPPTERELNIRFDR